jgi:hypothetical protein
MYLFLKSFFDSRGRQIAALAIGLILIVTCFLAFPAHRAAADVGPVLVSVTVSKTASRNILTLVYSEPVILSCASGASTATCGDFTTAGTLAGFGSFAAPGNVTVPTTKNTVAGSGTDTVTVTLADQAGGYINNGSTVGPSGVFAPISSAAVTDAAGNQVNAAATVTATVVNAWSLTQPTLVSVALSDANANGRVDTATLVFSAPVRAANITDADGLLGGAGHTGTFATSTNTTVFTVTVDNLPIDTSASAGPFTYSGATTRMTDLFGNLLATAAPGTIAATDYTSIDNALPVIIETSPVNGADHVGLAVPIVINFSESMNIANCVLSVSPASLHYASITSAANWNTSMDTVTLNNSSEVPQDTTVTVTVGGCTAAARPAALAANSAVPSTWTFTTLASDSSLNPVGGPVEVAPDTIDLFVPNGGETYAPGAQVSIDWVATADTFASYRVSYSGDNGATWTVLGAVVGESYTWTISAAQTAQGLIKVEGLDPNNNVLASTESASVFAVSSTATAPIAGNQQPTADPTVTGAYDTATAQMDNPDFNTDMNIPAATTATNCVSGTLIKSPDDPAVYYCGADGKRYVFVNDKAYFSWYPDFSTVKTISDTTLGNIMIGGNITYRPGTRMVKIVSDPKVYVVARGGILRWVETEAAATRLFGANWNTQIDDINDSFFVNYTVGAPIAE